MKKPFKHKGDALSLSKCHKGTRRKGDSTSLHEGAAALVGRCAAMARVMIESALGEGALVRGGRKGHHLDTHAQLHARGDRATKGDHEPDV